MITPNNNSNRLGARPSIKSNTGFMSLNSINSRSRSKHSQGQQNFGLGSYEAANEKQSYNNNEIDQLITWPGFNKKKSNLNTPTPNDNYSPMKNKNNSFMYPSETLHPGLKKESLPPGMKRGPSNRSNQSFGILKLERNESIGQMLANF